MDPQTSLPQKNLQDKIFEAFAQRNKLIISLFHFLYYLLAVFLIIGAYVSLTGNSLEPLFYNLGKKFGQGALLLLGVVVLPGILGRFKLEIKLTRLITVFRRQLGILVFISAFIHFSLVRGFPYITGLFPFKIFSELFIAAGFLALFLMFFMFLTSNNLSVKKLGRWWKKLHRIVYVILWVLVLHTGLQRISAWTVFISFFAALETFSWIYYFLKKPRVTGE